MYSVIDEISATLPVSGLMDGQRPWSRREVARVVLGLEQVVSARTAAPGGAALPARVIELVRLLAVAYDADIRQLTATTSAPAIGGAPLRAIVVGALGTNASPRGIPATGLGRIDAMTNPLVEPAWGRPVVQGGTGAIETIHEIGLGSHVAVAVQPRLTWLQPEDGSGHQSADFQRLYARSTLLNFAIEAGLDELLLGQAGERGMLLSANSRPLPTLSVGSDTSFVLPWLLRHLGRTRVVLMVSDLGREQNFPGAKLVTYKLSVAPTERLEMGAGLMDEMGGNGSPPCSFSCKMADLIPYLTWLRPRSDPLTTNKVADAELRYRVPEAAGLTVTYEGDIDDFDLRRLRSMLWDNTGHVLGARLDRLTPDGRLAVELQVHHTGLTLYKHSQYTSGLTYHRQIIGDPLGVNGDAAYGTLTWRQSAVTSVSLSPSLELRDGSSYSVSASNPNGEGWTYTRVVTRPRERRERAVLSFHRQVLGAGFGYSARIGVERVRNFDFVAGAGRTLGLAELTVCRYF